MLIYRGFYRLISLRWHVEIESEAKGRRKMEKQIDLNGLDYHERGIAQMQDKGLRLNFTV